MLIVYMFLVRTK